MSIRTEPKSFLEMYNWGWLTINTFAKYKDNPDAMRIVREQGLIVDCRPISKLQLEEYFAENKIDILDMELNFFVKYVLKLTQGRCNPGMLNMMYQEAQSVRELGIKNAA